MECPYRKLSGSFRAAVRIQPSKLVLFPVPPIQFLIQVTLVASDDHCDARRTNPPQRIENMDRTEHVGGKRLDRVLIGTAHQRLRREVKHEVRADLPHAPLYLAPITDVDNAVIQPVLEPERLKQVRLRHEIPGQPVDFGAQLEQPRGEPGTLEAGVPDDQYTLAPVDVAEEPARHHQIFHCARPASHNSSSWTLSRRVSMQRQKPSCR